MKGKKAAGKKRKDPHAVAMGKKGGKARAKALTPEQRQTAARKAVQSRWRRKKAD
jgi:hypothetical protein